MKSTELSKKKVIEFKESIPKGKAIKIKILKDNIIDNLLVSRTVVKNWCSHPYKHIIERNTAITNLKKLFKRSKYYGWAEDEIVIINGAHQQKHPNVKYWIYYEIVIKEETSYICVQVTNNGFYIPYCLDDQRSWCRIKYRVKCEHPPK